MDFPFRRWEVTHHNNAEKKEATGCNYSLKTHTAQQSSLYLRIYRRSGKIRIRPHGRFTYLCMKQLKSSRWDRLVPHRLVEKLHVLILSAIQVHRKKI